ncbi:alkaline phosphatase family protein [Marivibrio halodurans]|uniref:Alkaline phosphatase family protein n=1 Tax=Marivibrio halodurans TaxID=2039722 RepID=A0A8J7V1K0_9PROT|nr:alkaline phosphatase family protein [Marivibrio halodurans]MBP5857866.1 alkaline phosphatase family protein [Marivibrio halodurans]
MTIDPNRPSAIRNILLVTFDQWRWDCLSAMDHPLLRTPVLDAFAADATHFANHWSVTCPCGPARASLFTGTYLHRHRSLRNGTPLDARFTNLALETRRLGYDPALFGYTDISPDPRGRDGADPIFDSYEGVLPGMTRVCRLDDDFGTWFADLKAKGFPVPEKPWDIFRPTAEALAEAEAAGRAYCAAPARYKAADSNGAFLTNEVLRYLEARGGAPWFAHVSYISPHPPFIAPAPYHARYAPEKTPAPVRAESAWAEASVHPFLDFKINGRAGGTNAGVGAFVGRSVAPAEMADEELAQLRATYYGMINEVEDCFARILDWLHENDAYDETLIVLTSDHGEQLGDHWMLSKTGFFDESYRVPLIVRDPRPEAAAGRGRRVEAFTESVDVAPTVLSLLGAPVPRGMDGVPLLAWLEGRTPARWRDAAHVEYDFGDPVGRGAERALGLRSQDCGLAMINDGRFKYVHFQALPPLLYDLEADRHQLVNRADDPAYREVLAEMRAKLLSWRMASDEQTLTHYHIDRGATAYEDERFEGAL